MKGRSRFTLSKGMYGLMTTLLTLGSVFFLFQLGSYFLLTRSSSGRNSQIEHIEGHRKDPINTDLDFINPRFKHRHSDQRRAKLKPPNVNDDYKLDSVVDEEGIESAKINWQKDERKQRWDFPKTHIGKKAHPKPKRGPKKNGKPRVKVTMPAANIHAVRYKPEEQKIIKTHQASGKRLKVEIKPSPVNHLSGIAFAITPWSQGKISAKKDSNKDTVVLGTLERDQELYKPDNRGMFHCVNSKEATAVQHTVPYDRVNDGFCDCDDGSDEPGTSACPDSRFYCTFQLSSDPEGMWVRSSRVNDGVCDCCDGSDEWELDKLFDEGQVRGLKPFSGRCRNTCSALLSDEKARRHAQVEGAKKKQEYIEYAKVNQGASELHGENGEYYKLSKTCLEKMQGEYKFRVCPFDIVQQIALEGDRRTWDIGHGSSWDRDSTNKRYLQMDRGDHAGCPQGGRKSLIYFRCGVEDVITSAAETNRCEYTFHLDSPAAC